MVTSSSNTKWGREGVWLCETATGQKEPLYLTALICEELGAGGCLRRTARDKALKGFCKLSIALWTTRAFNRPLHAGCRKLLLEGFHRKALNEKRCVYVHLEHNQDIRNLHPASIS